MHTNTTKPKRQLDNGRDQSVQRAPLPQRKSVVPVRSAPAAAGRSPSADPFISKIANAEHEADWRRLRYFRFRKPLGRVGAVSIARDEAVIEVAVLKKISAKEWRLAEVGRSRETESAGRDLVSAQGIPSLVAAHRLAIA